MAKVYSGGKAVTDPWKRAEEIRKFPDKKAEWIWTSENSDEGAPVGKTTLSKSFFALPGIADVYSTCDNMEKVYLNGQKVIESDNWRKVKSSSVFLLPMNKIKVEAENTGGPAGLLLTVKRKLLGNVIVHSDTSWSEEK